MNVIQNSRFNQLLMALSDLTEKPAEDASSKPWPSKPWCKIQRSRTVMIVLWPRHPSMFSSNLFSISALS